jgi:hypothetical protein
MYEVETKDGKTVLVNALNRQDAVRVLRETYNIRYWDVVVFKRASN